MPTISRILGKRILRDGNHVFVLATHNHQAVVSFPVKHSWWEQADSELIRRSAEELVVLANETGWKRIVIPRPGCGNGRLQWEDVKPLLSCLDDRFEVISFD